MEPIEKHNAERPEEGRIQGAYDPEVPTNYFEALEEGLRFRPDYGRVYRQWNRIFRNSLNQLTSTNGLHLVGAFAQTDYLLKEHRASAALARRVNDTRVRLRKCGELTAEELQKWHLYDLRNLCRFVAFVCQVPVPEPLEKLFPAEREEHSTPSGQISPCLRMIVDWWDDDWMYGQVDPMPDGVQQFRVGFEHADRAASDWSYIRQMLRQGTQLNLVRPRIENDEILPELIIYEPDYLVDVSNISRCFTNYAESAVVNLLHRIEPQAGSEAILLGNFAGQLLDEQIHQQSATHTYTESAREFWQNNSLNLLTVGIGNTFHDEARAQQQHIVHALDDRLPKQVASYDPKECMVEPSFFSEMLGIQGRMDFLQLDYSLLLEQKSGKGDFPYDNFEKPRFKEDHYVQMLLYMMIIRYNFSEIYEKNQKSLFAFLLYSKYKEGLVGLGFAPDLMHRALKVRNSIVFQELLAAQADGYRLLETLTPELVNEKKANNPLWTRFQSPHISELLDPIRQASPLEKAYYYRFLSFIANEHLHSKLGNKVKENSGFASTWHDSLDEKLQAGNIYAGLKLLSPDADTEGTVETVTLGFADNQSSDTSNFRVGDIVILYPYDPGKEPDARMTMVFRSTIRNIETDSVELVLRAKQSDARVFRREQGKVWAIEHDFMESSYSSLYRAMHAFLSAPKQRRDLLLLQRDAGIDPQRKMRGDYGAFNPLVSRQKQATDLFLLIGPPGTGKTSFGLLNILKEELTEADSTVLLVSYTNRAVDEICSKLYSAGIDFIRIGGELTCSPEYRANLLSSRTLQCQRVSDLAGMIARTRVIVGTTSAINAGIELFSIKQFSLAIVDEASQLLEPHLIGLLSAQHNGVPAIGRFVMIGDHKQLPAVVQQGEETSLVDDASLRAIHLTDCRLSLFERLLKSFRLPDGRYDERFVFMLHKQGRMHHDIALFPSYAFYASQLEVAGLEHQNATLPASSSSDNSLDNLLLTRRIAFLNVDTPAVSESDKVNQKEADVIAALVVRIYGLEKSCFDEEKTVGVIVPYRNQIAAIRNTIDRSGIDCLHNITIDTVERYQGSQRKYIIYGFTIQKYQQLHFLTSHVFEEQQQVIDRKLNVAMTRAEEHLLLVGNAGLLANNYTFNKLIEFVRSKHCYFDHPTEVYLQGKFEVPEAESTDIDLSQVSFPLTPAFAEAFEQCVIRPLRSHPKTQWPCRIFGYDMATVMNAIGYGRAQFAEQIPMTADSDLSPREQVLAYCYYLMRQYYCCSRQSYAEVRQQLEDELQAVGGRLQFIDIGCGPATGGIAFAEQFHRLAPAMGYTGIDPSAEMRLMGTEMLQMVFGNRLNQRMLETFDALDSSFWLRSAESPSLVVFNLSYFFANVTSRYAERLGMQCAEIIRNYPENRYFFMVHQNATESGLNALKVFLNVLAPCAESVREQAVAVRCTQGGRQTYDYSYSYTCFFGSRNP